MQTIRRVMSMAMVCGFNYSASRIGPIKKPIPVRIGFLQVSQLKPRLDKIDFKTNIIKRAVTQEYGRLRRAIEPIFMF